MSRLDSFIRRMQAQRACLEEAAGLIAGLPGLVLELGLGNGRTYDHLRQILPDREIYAFDHRVAAHPDCIPASDHLFLGDLASTLPRALQRLGPAAALAHLDLGSGDKEQSLRQASALIGLIVKLLKSGAIMLSDQELTHPDLRPMDLPEGVKPGRYFLFRFTG